MNKENNRQLRKSFVAALLEWLVEETSMVVSAEMCFFHVPPVDFLIDKTENSSTVN